MINYSYDIEFKSKYSKDQFSKYFKNKKLNSSDYLCLNLNNLDEIKAFHAFLSNASEILSKNDIEIRDNLEIYKDLSFEFYSKLRKNLSYQESEKLFDLIYSLSQENRESDLIEMIEKIAEFYRIDHYIADL